MCVAVSHIKQWQLNGLLNHAMLVSYMYPNHASSMLVRAENQPSFQERDENTHVGLLVQAVTHLS